MIAGFEDEATARTAAAALGRAHGDLAGLAKSLVVEPVDPSNWVDATTTGRVDIDGQRITFDVGPAFGHGAHPTTSLALALAALAIAPGDAVLDFGAGTGVLTLAAARFGAKRLVAIENDPDALAVARGNLAPLSNEPATEIEVVEVLPPIPAITGTGRRGARFDVILANVLLPVHVEHGRQLIGRLTPSGSLIVSGLLVEQEEQLLAAYLGLHVENRLVDGDWLALALGRSEPGSESESVPER